ncbi:hypothetical protein [Streptomyces sp. NPDC059916]|uniref:hypothetical protein n=1 Tax=Streptomyces sp. NPDC059916 TaxID=3347001 RepID=UPI00368FC0B7
MDASTALRRLAMRAESEFRADEAARARLAEDLGKGAATDLVSLIDAALVASANAKPWRQLMQRIERHGVREGLAKQQAEVLEALLSYGLCMSTSQVANAARLAEQDGMRRFLNRVDTIEIDEPSPELPPVIEGQREILRAIKDTGVVLREAHVLDGGVRTANRAGTIAPAVDRVQWFIRQGWAQADTTAELRDGQAVTLTELGEALLAS